MFDEAAGYPWRYTQTRRPTYAVKPSHTPCNQSDSILYTNPLLLKSLSKLFTCNPSSQGGNIVKHLICQETNNPTSKHKHVQDTCTRKSLRGQITTLRRRNMAGAVPLRQLKKALRNETTKAVRQLSDDVIREQSAGVSEEDR